MVPELSREPEREEKTWVKIKPFFSFVYDMRRIFINGTLGYIGFESRNLSHSFLTFSCCWESKFLHDLLTIFLTDLVTWYTMRGLIPPSPGRNRVKTQLYRHLRFPFSVHMKYALITHEGNRWFVHLMVSIGMAAFWKKNHSGLPGVIRLIWEKIVPWVFLTNRNI